MGSAASQVLLDHPRVREALQAAREHGASQVDSDLLAVAEHRICQLLGASQPTSAAAPETAATEVGRAVLAFVEQWVIDVANITDDMVATLRTHLGEDRLMDFVHGVLLIEQRVRLDMAWSRLGLSA